MKLEEGLYDYLNTSSAVMILNEIRPYKKKRFVLYGQYLLNDSTAGGIELQGVFIKSRTTGEQIQFRDFAIDEDTKQFTVNIDLENDFLYEGAWVFRCVIKVNGREEIVPIKYNHLEDYVQGDFVKYNDELYFYEMYKNKNESLAIRIKRNNLSFVNSDIHKIEIINNHLLIKGKFTFNLAYQITDQVNEVVFIHRNLYKRFSVPLQLDETGSFNLSVGFNQLDLLVEEKGIWDVWVSYTVNGITELSRVDMNMKEIEDIYSGSKKPMWGPSDIMRSVRPYITMGDNLAFLVDENVFLVDVVAINYSMDSLNVTGLIFNQELEFELMDMQLEDETGEHVIQCVNNFTKNEALHYFKTEIKLDGLSNLEEINYHFYITVQVKQKLYKFRLVSNYDDILDKSKVMRYPPLPFSVNNYPLKAIPFYSRSNVLGIAIRNTLNAKCISIKHEKNRISLKVQADLDGITNGYENKELVLIGKNTGSILRVKPETQDENVLLFTINKEEILDKSAEYNESFDLFFRGSIGDKYIQTRLYSDTDSVLNKYSTFTSNAVPIDQGRYFSIFANRKNKIIGAEIRELKAFEKKSEKTRFLMAKGIAKVLRRFVKKPIWLIGENLGEVAGDNGFAFFEYCMKNKSKERYFYVSKPDNKNADNLALYQENVLRYDSFKHMVYYWLSQYLIVSHGIRDVIPSVIHNKMGKNPKKVIYLQHGIIAMKKLKFKRSSYNGKIKKFVVSSVQEKRIMVEEMNFRPEQIMVTGLARFDSLEDRSNEHGRSEILLMPTWRDWAIDSEQDFLASDFYNYYIDFLNDQRLHEILEKNNLTLKFFPHVEIQKKYIQYFSSLNKNIKIVKIGEESIRDLMQNSKLMITDYSSVAFDFNYMEKPIIFYQFDLHEYLKYRGSYVDLSRDLVGDVVYEKKELISQINHYVENEFEYKNEYKAKSRRYYAYQDRCNADRIYNEIKRLSKK